MGKNSGECESTLSFEQLDLLMGDHAPFLIALSDGAGEELHLTISTADIGEKGENVPDFSEMDARSSEVLAGILSKARPITPGERQYDIGFTDYILYQTRNESFCSFDREEIRRGKYLIDSQDQSGQACRSRDGRSVGNIYLWGILSHGNDSRLYVFTQIEYAGGGCGKKQYLDSNNR